VNASLERRAALFCAWAAALAYLALALWIRGPVLDAPTEKLLGRSEPGIASLARGDQFMVLSVVVRNARLLLSRPWDLREEGHCHPTPRAYTLGEHMLGNGVLAALPYVLSQDPILSYNAIIVLTLWLPALAMYSLSFHFTRSPAAAFVAGLAFACSRSRLVNVAHPYVYGDLWAPLLLLSMHRLFVRKDWIGAAGIALFASLQVAESLYALLSTAMIGAVYGVYLVYRHARVLREIAVKLIAAGLAPILLAWWLLGPYLSTGATWGVLEREYSLFATPAQFGFGGPSFPGVVVLTLVTFALLDRVRRPRLVHGEDPRLALLVGGLLVAWSAVYGVRVPGIGLVLPSPLRMVRDLVPGLSSVRVLGAVQSGVTLAAAFLAGYGVLAVTERFAKSRARIALGIALSLTLLLEVFYTPLSQRSFGKQIRLEPYRARPSEADLRLLENAVEGPVLDLPHVDRQLNASARFLLLSAFHGRPVAACYNSFEIPVQQQVVRLAQALPDVGATQALAAIGFRTVLVHPELLSPVQRERLDDFEARLTAAGLEPIGRTETIHAYRLSPPRAIETSLDVLALAAEHGRPSPREDGTGPAPLVVSPPESEVTFELGNRTGSAFRHPDPIAPSDLVIGWVDDAGERVAESRARALLPLAIAPAGAATVDLKVPVPVADGDYAATLSPAAQPELVLSRRRVRVAGSRRSR
jgi:hypothetical protein